MSADGGARRAGVGRDRVVVLDQARRLAAGSEPAARTELAAAVPPRATPAPGPVAAMAELVERLATIAEELRERPVEGDRRVGVAPIHVGDGAAAALLVAIERCRDLAASAAAHHARTDADLGEMSPCGDPAASASNRPESASDRPAPANDGGDPRLARALAALRRQLGSSWTVASLARVAGMSRAAFARLFVARLGVPPLRYLAEMRMREAARLLLATDEGLAAIAGRLGYASEFAFSRAFKRHTGVAPAIHRRRERERRYGPRALTAPPSMRAAA